MHLEFIKWLEEQTYEIKIYSPSRGKNRIDFYWTDEKYDDSENWDWDDIKEVYWSRNRYI